MGGCTKSLAFTIPLAMLSLPLATPLLAQGRSGVLEEILVSAQRREQSLQEVPISIAAISAEAVDTFRIASLTDINNLVPNLTAVEGSGGTRSVLYQMRGLIGAGTALGADSGIATYLDGVYLPGGSGSVVSYAEVERIEVLRGPQGTLFGRNTSGGAIHFITSNPTGEFGVKQTFTVGDYELFRSKTHINTPKVGPVSAALTYSYTDREGDVHNSGGGFPLDFSQVNGDRFRSPDTLGAEKTKAVFLAVDFDFIENLDLVYKFNYMDNEGSPPAVGILGYDPVVLAGLAPFIPPSLSATRPNKVNNALTTESTSESKGHNLTATYRLSDEVSLKNILSYREFDYAAPGHNLDGIGALSTFLGFGFVGVFDVASAGTAEQTSEEFQIIYDADSLTLTSGALYYKLDQDNGPYANAMNGIFGGSLFPGFATSEKSQVTVKSVALYSQAEFHITPQWDLIAGGRVTNDQKDYVDRTTGVVVEPSFDKGDYTYLLGVNYKPTEDLMVYAKLSTGYISGGVVSGLAYEPETAKSLEAGLKGTWFGGTLQTNLSAFDVDYKNQQFGTAGSLVNPPVNASQVLINAGDTSARGFELETNWLPIDSVRLALNLGYLDFQIEDVNEELLGGPLVAHVRPDWNGMVMAEYQSDPLFDDVTVLAHIDASYRSQEYVATRDTPFSEREVNGDSWRVGAQLTLSGFHLASGELSVALWGRNLLDNDQPVNMNTLGPIIAGQYEPARSYGVDVTFEL